MCNLLIRTMKLLDLPRVQEIEEECFSMPWSRDSFVRELNDNHFSHYVVATVDDVVIGYVGCWFVVDEAQITTIAIHPDYQGQGLGRSLLQHIMKYLKENSIVALFLEVRPSNKKAQSLYCQLGFKKLGLREKYYADNQEDAIVMGVSLLETRQRSNCSRNRN